MAFTLAQVIDAARGRHAAFHKTRVPAKVVGDFAGDYQNDLIQKALQRDRQYCFQQSLVLLDLTGSAPGTVGAGVGDGLPGQETPGGGFEIVAAPAGNLVSAIVDPAFGATEFVAEGVATAVGASTISRAASGWTVNAFTNRVVVITAGPGFGQRREIASNTSSQLTTTQPWAAPLPTTASLFRVVEPVYTGAEDMGVVTALPAYVQEPGYLVKIDANGNPFIDFTAALFASMEVGVPLPPSHALLGGTVLYTDGERDPLTLTTPAARLDPPQWPAAFTLSNTLFLCGSSGDWQDVVSIELRYAPIAPVFTGTGQFFVLPDAARACVVDAAASFMAMRVAGEASVAIDARVFASKAAATEANYLSSLRLTRSARQVRFREGAC